MGKKKQPVDPRVEQAERSKYEPAPDRQPLVERGEAYRPTATREN